MLAQSPQSTESKKKSRNDGLQNEKRPLAQGQRPFPDRDDQEVTALRQDLPPIQRRDGVDRVLRDRRQRLAERDVEIVMRGFVARLLVARIAVQRVAHIG